MYIVNRNLRLICKQSNKKIFLLFCSAVLVLWIVNLFLTHDHHWLSKHSHIEQKHKQHYLWPKHPKLAADLSVENPADLPQDEPHQVESEHDEHHLLQRGGKRNSHPKFLKHNDTDDYPEDDHHDGNTRHSSGEGEVLPSMNEPLVNVTVQRQPLNEQWIQSKQDKLLKFMKHPPVVRNPYAQTEIVVNTYDMKENIGGHYDCLRLKLRPDPMICLYPDAEDKYISHDIRHTGMWEKEIVDMLVHILLGDEDLDLIDIGANLGVYTLVAAAMGRNVLAVEPYIGHLHHLHKSVNLGNSADRITVIADAISNERQQNMHIHLADKQNLGALMIRAGCPKHAKTKGTCFSTITMDDITDLAVQRFPKRKAILKIDIEGHESQALEHSTRLFDSVYIPYILMEWHQQRDTFIGLGHESPEKDRALHLIWMLNARGYSGYTYTEENTLRLLQIHEWYGWPDDIVWKHEHAST